MSHPAQLRFVGKTKELWPDHFHHKNVLEVGSLDINGSVRGLFDECNYTGLDVAPGAGVDLVCGGHEHTAPDESYDVVISCECFEHNPYWEQTLANMWRMLKSDGLIVISCAGSGRAEHGTARTDPGSSPLTVELGWNYYRNLIPADFENGELRRIGVENYWINQNWAAFDLYFVAWKSTLRDKGRADQFSQAAAQLNDWVTSANSSWLARVRKSTSFLLGENNFNRLRHSPLLSRIYYRIEGF